LQAALASEPGIDVVGATDSIDEALALAAQSNPGLVIAELQLGARSAIDLLVALRQAGSKARLLVLTSETSEAHLRLAMKAGAHAYLLKEDGYSELLEALRVVSAGRRFSATRWNQPSSGNTRALAVRFSGKRADHPRQREVLARIARDRPTRSSPTRCTCR
jgi:two-component system response regulator DesR